MGLYTESLLGQQAFQPQKSRFSTKNRAYNFFFLLMLKNAKGQRNINSLLNDNNNINILHVQQGLSPVHCSLVWHVRVTVTAGATFGNKTYPSFASHRNVHTEPMKFSFVHRSLPCLKGLCLGHCKAKLTKIMFIVIKCDLPKMVNFEK